MASANSVTMWTFTVGGTDNDGVPDVLSRALTVRERQQSSVALQAEEQLLALWLERNPGGTIVFARWDSVTIDVTFGDSES